MELQRGYRGGVLRTKQGGLAHSARGRLQQGGIPSPPVSHYGGGVPLNFSQVFSKKELSMENVEKLQRELHSAVLTMLRQGFTLQSVIHALIVESEKLSDSAAVVQAINDFNQQP